MSKQQQTEAPRVVKARVRPFHTYGTSPAGSIVEVEAAELARVPYCLQSIEDEQKQAAKADESAVRKAAEVEAINRLAEANTKAFLDAKARALRQQREDAAKVLVEK